MQSCGEMGRTCVVRQNWAHGTWKLERNWSGNVVPSAFSTLQPDLVSTFRQYSPGELENAK